MTVNPYLNVIQIPVQKLQEQSPEAREKVYQRARESLTNQVRRANPSMSETRIEEQRKKLEQAIAEIEEKYAAERLDVECQAVTSL